MATITITDALGKIDHVPTCGGLIMPRNEECTCGATFTALVARTLDSDYVLLRDAIGEHLHRFLEDDDVAEVAIYLVAIERASKHIAWLEAGPEEPT